jgi:hypothetical protein
MMMSLFFEAEAEEDKAQTVVAASEPSRTARQRWKAELGTVCGATAFPAPRAGCVRSSFEKLYY